jgi:hypothetical protein
MPLHPWRLFRPQLFQLLLAAAVRFRLLFTVVQPKAVVGAPFMAIDAGHVRLEAPLAVSAQLLELLRSGGGSGGGAERRAHLRAQRYVRPPVLQVDLYRPIRYMRIQLSMFFADLTEIQ